MTDFNAVAVTHVLSTAGEIIIASKRIRLSQLTRDAPDRSAASPRGQCSPSAGFPTRRIQCGLDVGCAAVDLAGNTLSVLEATM